MPFLGFTRQHDFDNHAQKIQRKLRRAKCGRHKDSAGEYQKGEQGEDEDKEEVKEEYYEYIGRRHTRRHLGL